MKRQSGFAQMVPVVLILVLVISMIIGMIYKERKDLVQKIEDKTTEIGQLDGSIRTLESTTNQLKGEIEALSNLQKAEKDISKGNSEIRAQREKDSKGLEQKLKTSRGKLPAALEDGKVAKPTTEEQKNSVSRIDHLWDVYTLDMKTPETDPAKLIKTPGLKTKEK